jgi:hypothetical protein
MNPFRFGVDVAHAPSRLEWTESVRESNTMPPNVGGKGTCPSDRLVGYSDISEEIKNPTLPRSP